MISGTFGRAAALVHLVVAALAAFALAAEGGQDSLWWSQDFSLGDLSGWTAQCPAGSVWEVAPDGYRGSNALGLVSLGGGEVRLERSWRVALPPGGKLSVSFMMKAPVLGARASATAFLQRVDAEGAHEDSFELQASPGWRESHLEVTVAPGFEKFTLAFALRGPGRLVIDDIRVFCDASRKDLELLPETLRLEGRFETLAGKTVVRNTADVQRAVVVSTRLVDFHDPTMCYGQMEKALSLSVGAEVRLPWVFDSPVRPRLLKLVAELSSGQKSIASEETIIIDRRPHATGRATRAVVELAGLWRASIGGSGAPGVPVRVPTRMDASEEILLKRGFDLPRVGEGRRWMIEISGILSPTDIVLDGGKIYSSPGEGDVVQLDVTEALKEPGRHEIALVMSPGRPLGISGAVRLVSVPALFVEAISPRTSSLEEKSVRVRCTVRNADGMERRFSAEIEIFDGAKSLGKSGSVEEITIAPGATASVDLTVTAPDAELWTVTDPRIYGIVCRIHSESGFIDAFTVSTGLRTADTGGGYLRLNNEAFPLRIARPALQGGVGDLGRVLEEVLFLKSIGLNALIVRSPGRLVEMCDLAGMGTLFELRRRENAEAVALSLSAHPSILIWKSEAPLDSVKGLDPARPTASRDAASDILLADAWAEDALTRPASQPSTTRDAEARPATTQAAASRPDETQPVIVLGVAAEPPATLEEARLFTDCEGLAEADAIGKARRAYYEDALRDIRILQIAGFEMGVRDREALLPAADALSPLRPFLLTKRSSFYAGAELAIPVAVRNDLAGERKVKLEWKVQTRDRPIAGAEDSRTMTTGEVWRKSLSFNAPATGQRAEIYIALEARSAGERAEIVRALSVFPRPMILEEGLTVGVVARDGEVAGCLEQLSVTPLAVDGPGSERLEDLQTIVVCDLPQDRRDAWERAIIDFAQRGGRAIILRQKSYGTHFRELADLAAARRGGRVLIDATGHPVLAGLEEGDLQFDGERCRALLLRAAPGARSILSWQGEEGRKGSVLAEVPRGEGLVLLVQLDLVAGFSDLPAAGWLLKNALEYASTYSPAELPASTQAR